MIYLVHTLKQQKEKTINTDFVIEADSEEIIKVIMNNCKVIVLSTTLVPWWPKSWTFFANLQYEEKILKCCIAADNIEHACQRCTLIDLPIVSIQDINNPISSQESESYIQKFLEERKLQIEQEKQKENKEKKEKTIDMSNRKQKKITEIITQTLEDINKLPSNVLENRNLVSEIHELNDLKEMLTKIKMWSNVEKSTQVLERVFTLMEKIELTNIIATKTENLWWEVWEKILTDDSVDFSDSDIINELWKLKRAKQGQQIGMNQWIWDIYYTVFWLIGLYQKFIAKDIIKKISKIKDIISWIIVYIHFIIIQISLYISLRIMRLSFLHEEISQYISMILVVVGIVGTVWLIPLAFRKKHILFVLFWIIVAIIIAITLQSLIKNTFALL